MVGPQLASLVAHSDLMLLVFEQHHAGELGQRDHGV
jgi:hypothetical protein